MERSTSRPDADATSNRCRLRNSRRAGRSPKKVFRTGETKLIDDLFDSPNAADHEGTIALGIRNVLCAPLTTIQYVENEQAAEAGRRIGVLYLDSRERKSFKSTTLRVAMETLANEAAGAIENARLYRESQERAKLEQDLQTAHEFQQALLPKSAPNLGFFRAAASMVPCPNDRWRLL